MLPSSTPLAVRITLVHDFHWHRAFCCTRRSALWYLEFERPPKHKTIQYQPLLSLLLSYAAILLSGSNLTSDDRESRFCSLPLRRCNSELPSSPSDCPSDASLSDRSPTENSQLARSMTGASPPFSTSPVLPHALMLASKSLTCRLISSLSLASFMRSGLSLTLQFSQSQCVRTSACNGGDHGHGSIKKLYKQTHQ